MSDYSPIFNGQPPYTSTASAAITGGQLCEVSGSGTVGPAGAASAKVVGVALFDAATNALVTLARDGIQSLTASGAITAGDQLVAAAAGKVSTQAAAAGALAADINNARAIVGVALTTAADTAQVQVSLRV